MQRIRPWLVLELPSLNAADGCRMTLAEHDCLAVLLLLLLLPSSTSAAATSSISHRTC